MVLVSKNYNYAKRKSIMAMYMLMAKYSPTAMKGILKTGSDREAAARAAVEAAGGKLHGFYGRQSGDCRTSQIAKTGLGP